MDEFELIYRQYFALVFSYARRLTGSDHLAEELTADTFFKALKALKRYDGQENLQAWLCTIAKNTWRSQHRKYGRITSLEHQPEPQDSADSPAQALENRDATWRLHEVLHAMPEPYKEVFSLRVFGELPFAHIAALFGKTETWARVTYHRAKQKIYAQMEDYHD
ncbi:MAG: RNA polymerase sigma factor [Oscillospiraceae bacterium]|nr:RNA polymerase sigma factor [Oscillospiraceae bacterium]